MICVLFFLATTGCGGGVRDLSLIPDLSKKHFNVTTYGAKGDGATDDAPAIERAMKAAAESGGQVVFPCGEFALKSSAGAAPASRSLLYLKNASAIQLMGQGKCSHLFTTMHAKSVLEFEDSQYISINNLRFTALNAPYVETFGMDGGSAVRFSGVTHGNISGIEVDGASAGAIYLTKGTSESSVTSNYVHDTDGSAVWEDDCGAANDKNCQPSMPPADNVYESNTFTDTSMLMGSAMVLDDGNGDSGALVLKNKISWNRPAVASNLKVHCIQVNNASYISVVGNSCDATPWDGIVITTGPTGRSLGVKIKANTIKNSGTASIGGSGIVVYDDPQGRGISGFVIESNTIETAGDDGIRLFSASKKGTVQKAQVLNNTIHMVDQRQPGSRYGIDIEYSATVTADGNVITCDKKCIAAGVNVNSSIATIPTATSNHVDNILGAPLVIQ